MRSSRAVLTGWTFSGVSQVSVPKSPTGIYLDRKTERKKLLRRDPPLQREVIAQFVKKLE